MKSANMTNRGDAALRPGGQGKRAYQRPAVLGCEDLEVMAADCRSYDFGYGDRKWEFDGAMCTAAQS